MTTSPDLGVPYVPSPPPAQAEVLHNEALNMLIALQKGAIDRGLNTPPGSPTDGDVYILGAAPTGAWSGKANKIAVYTGTAWTFVPGNDSDGADIAIGARHEGLKLWVNDEDALYVWSGSAWVQRLPALSGSYYDFGFVFEDTPAADAIVGRVRIARNITVPANMSGASGGVDTNPTATFDIDVRDDGASIGTISVSTSGVFTFTTTSGTAKAIAAGSEILFVAPATPDATVAGLSAVIAATVD